MRNATAPPKTKNGKPKKRVTIISPPQSPVDVPERPRRLSDGKTGSPPPPPVTVTPEDVAATNATSTADPDLQRALLNTQRNSDGAEPLPPPGPTGVMRAPYNPFARTLATSDAQLGVQRATTEERGNERPAGGPPKMNVDMFKNLLMTGSASPSPPVTQHTQPQQPQDSSTDTSSVSRQSLFDPAHELHPESPRTSFDQQSISDKDEEEDNEHVSLMVQLHRGQNLKAHRHHQSTGMERLWDRKDHRPCHLLISTSQFQLAGNNLQEFEHHQ